MVLDYAEASGAAPGLALCPGAGMKVFEDLGLLVERLWREKNYHDGVFPEIAARALEETGLTGRVSPWEIVRWVHTAHHLPRQQDVEARFGNPPITLYNGPRFHIDIYFWTDGTTEIHQHGFAGAFQVLAGSSIHSLYDFKEEHVINPHFSLGRVLFKQVEMLKTGDIRPIVAGKRFIHALFHLDRPSATITVRTYGSPQAQPQYSYRKPYLAYDPFFREESAVKKLQTVSLLLSVEHAEAFDLIGDLVAESDFQTAFAILDVVSRTLSSNQLKRVFRGPGDERFNELLVKARRRHGQLVDLIPPILEEDRRLSDIVNRRSSITGKEHRFFLALLLNVPSRAKLLDLVKQYFPQQEPVETVLDWVMELSTTKVWGSSEANVLGIKDFDDDYLFALQCLLKGLSHQETEAALRKEYPPKRARELAGRLERVCRSLRESTPLRSILAG
jgi:hypothetical protein